MIIEKKEARIYGLTHVVEFLILALMWEDARRPPPSLPSASTYIGGGQELGGRCRGDASAPTCSSVASFCSPFASARSSTYPAPTVALPLGLFVTYACDGHISQQQQQ